MAKPKITTPEDKVLKDQVASELNAAKQLAKSLNFDEVKSGEWFIGLLLKVIQTYDRNARATYFQKKYPGLTPDDIADTLTSVTVRYATIAGAIAGAVKASRATFLTNVPGVQVNGEVVSHLTTAETQQLIDAGESFGATRRQLLWKVELPHAMPTIMAGLTQCIMLSLSMVVIAALVGADGLGKPVVRALTTINVAQGFEAGLSIVIVAILLDRVCKQRGAQSRQA